MREMNPRIWNKILGEIAIIDVIDWNEKYVIVSKDYVWNEDPETGEAECQVFFKDLELMWPTGLKDKSGQPIFEGDIVHEYCSNPNVDWTYEVYYDSEEGKFWLRNAEEVYGQWNVYDDPAYVRWSTYEVIGNMYESPELIAK